MHERGDDGPGGKDDAYLVYFIVGVVYESGSRAAQVHWSTEGYQINDGKDDRVDRCGLGKASVNSQYYFYGDPNLFSMTGWGAKGQFWKGRVAHEKKSSDNCVEQHESES